VTMDPNAKERDRSDMNWCLIDDTMEKEAFKELYPDANADPVNSDSVDDMGTWYSDNSVKISEYFTREPCIKEVALLSDGRSVYMDELEPVVDELLAKGVSIVRTRKVKTYKVFWRKITGLDVLEGPVELPCSTIPVVPVWGKALVIKKKIIFRSIIRHSKDAQRMANYWDSAATEAVALAPKAPFIGSEGHTEGYEHQWETANTVNRSVLTYVPQYQGDPGPRREQPAAIPAAEITLGMNSSEKIKATLGMYDASLGAMGNETSGRAIVARQRQGDRGSFAFIDNLTKAIRRVGKIMVEMTADDTRRT
ncbi:portal protein, partial [Marinobacter sp.]|uniref:portal protein n=1 Tax=Marinobacter sp. TaxID=50741 RepID=UPI0035C6E545